MNGNVNQEIEFYIFDEDNRKWVHMPNAKPITLPGYADLNLFIHRDPYGKYKGWVVSEALSGHFIAYDAVQSVAKAEAAMVLNRNIDSFGAVLLKKMKKNGLSPWFREYFGMRRLVA